MMKTMSSLWALRESLAFQLGVWGLAITLCVLLTSAVRELTRVEALKAELVVPTIDARSVPLRKDDYLAVRERVGRANNDGAVKVSVAEDGLTVKAAKLEDYTQWRIALADVMLSMPGAVWTVKTLCAGEQCTDGVFSVTLLGTVRSFAVGTPAAAAPMAVAAESPAPVR